MGIIADLFVATPESAAGYAASQQRERAAHIQRYQPAEFKGLTSLEFGTFWALLSGEEWDVKRHMLEEVAYGEGNESWLCRFPAPLVVLLAALSDLQLDRYAADWAQTEELQMSGFTAENTKEVVTDLVRLARSAQSSDRGMYLWGSL